MKRVLSATAVVFVVAGCGDGSINDYYRQGLTYKQKTDTVTNCEVYAAQQVPVNTQIYTTPTYTAPAQTFCNQIGSQTFCNTTGGSTYGGQTSTFDANSALRTKVFNQCLSNNGITYNNFKECSAEQAANYRPSSVLPKLTGETCFIRFEDKTIAYHTP